MAAKEGMDRFANYAIVSVTEGAANTLTFKKLETGISLMDKVAWIINRIEYFVQSIDATVFNGSGDSVSFGLSVSNSFASATLTEETIIDMNTIARTDWGTAASAILIERPLIRDLSTLPGGGKMVPPVPLYLWCQGNGEAAANAVIARIHYTTLALAEADYWAMVSAYRILSS